METRTQLKSVIFTKDIFAVQIGLEDQDMSHRGRNGRNNSGDQSARTAVTDAEAADTGLCQKSARQQI